MCLDNEAKRAEQCYTLSPSEERRCLEEQRRDSRECEKKCDSVEVEIDPSPPPPGQACRLACLDDEISRDNYCRKLSGDARKRCEDDSREVGKECLARCRRR